MPFYPLRTLALSMLLLGSPNVLLANDGDPLAVRRWPGGVISLETQWGLQLVVDPTHGPTQPRFPRADRTLTLGAQLDHQLSRLANTAAVSWLNAADANEQDPNALSVKSIWPLGNETSLLMHVDGVRIVYVPAPSAAAIGDRDSIPFDLDGISNPDLLILATDKVADLTAPGCVALIHRVEPKRVLLNRIDIDQATKLKSLGQSIDAATIVKQIDHNTLALSKQGQGGPLQLLLMSDQPWKMSPPLTELFDAMERANQASQEVFAKLSAQQLNFKPANRTHTPRWNCEHMMGRQLLFFSQIYNAQDPAIAVVDLNPKQMPPDYEFAHPDWDGQEEARQMQRVAEFTRRFAYLLDGVELNDKAPGSRWTLRGLLKQMERHYNEHTANTIKKFDLPGWPTE